LSRATPTPHLPALPAHLNTWPRDALVLGTTAFTNGLIGSSGRAGQKRALLDLLDRLAPSYGDDWWFTAHHGMALSENGQRDAARPKIDRSLAKNPINSWAAHARAHLSYEDGNPNAARAFLTSWLTTYQRNGLLYSHLSWHRALGDLEAGDAAAAFRLFKEAFSPDVHSGPPRGKVNDAVSLSVALGTRRASAERAEGGFDHRTGRSAGYQRAGDLRPTAAVRLSRPRRRPMPRSGSCRLSASTRSRATACPRLAYRKHDREIGADATDGDGRGAA
jgi:hypothetical protein